ncbi:tetratricopeptide repeat protein [Ktedonospora formicarum]|uniref:tetratricopeptide repeat protein n=1 Tax=Ktedonospora formicarum TaxID=2778364 RepID=UPI001C69279D|nr:tetratricopeptide repeat protein [Ktedonospora formicarum]
MVRTYVNRAACYMNLHQPAAALADAEEAVRRDPKLVLAYRNRGYAYFLLKDYARALADLEYVFQLKPALVDNVLAIVNIHLASGNYQTAIDLLNERIHASPKQSGYYHQLGYAYLLLHDYRRSIECYQCILSMKVSTDAICRAYNNLGCVYFKLRDLSNARASFEAGLRRDPKHHTLLFSLVEVYIILHIDSQDVPRLLERLESVIANTPKCARSLYDGLAAYWRGDYTDACAQLGYAILEEPFSLTPHLWYCLASAAGKHDDLALKALEHVLEIEERDSVGLIPLRLIVVTNPSFYAAHVQAIVEAIPLLTDEPTYFA